MDTLDFSGQVAIVTGAGRGIGRAYAELLAARGAAVVVNDLGATLAGGGRDETLAASVAGELVARGGTAVPNGSDIATADGAAALVAQALDSFGRIDMLVLNAGIFGLDAFPDLDFAVLEQFFRVHVGGSYHVVQAAWPTMAAARYGRIVLTTSTSTFGAADTVAYSTAKSAVIGLGRALALAGEPEGIKVNLVAPTASTRMMARGMGRDEPVADPALAPELVPPLVALLCHESCPTSGDIYAGGVRRYNRIVSAANVGYSHPGLTVSPEELREHWDEIADPDGLEVIRGVQGWAGFNKRHTLALDPGPDALDPAPDAVVR